MHDTNTGSTGTSVIRANVAAPNAANRDAARLCGIPAKNMVTLSFMLSAGIGAMAGCVTSPLISAAVAGPVPL